MLARRTIHQCAVKSLSAEERRRVRGVHQGEDLFPALAHGFFDVSARFDCGG
jgi:hypothetical protein